MEYLTLESQVAVMERTKRARDVISRMHGEPPHTLAAVESTAPPPELVNPMQWLTDAFGRSMPHFVAHHRDRDRGRQRPVFETEQDLTISRGVARYLCLSNGYAKGVMERLEDYNIGRGMSVKAEINRAQKRTQQRRDLPDIVTVANEVLEDFNDREKWVGLKDVEKFRRWRRDGEVIDRICEDTNGSGKRQPVHRFIEPSYLREPVNPGRDLEPWLQQQYRNLTNWQEQHLWTFGVHRLKKDEERVFGYFVEWEQNDWEYLPAGEVEHLKANVDSNVCRGWTDFYPIAGKLNDANDLSDSITAGATAQAKIAFIRKHAAGLGEEGIAALVAAVAEATTRYRPGGGTETSYTERFDKAQIIDGQIGDEWEHGPMGTPSGPVHIQSLDSCLRGAAVVWGLPFHMVSSDSSNENYASILEAGSPFKQALDKSQGQFCASERRMYWKVLFIAWKWGAFQRFGLTWDELRRVIILNVEPPPLPIADRSVETTRWQTLHAAGALSLPTWQQKEGLDSELEAERGARTALTGGAGGGAGAAGGMAAAGAGAMGETPDPRFGGAMNEDPRFAESRGEMSNMSRLQWRRNFMAMQDVCRQVQDGDLSAVMGEEALMALGLTPERAKRLVDEATTLEDFADTLYGRTALEAALENCGTGAGGFQSGNDCAGGGGGAGGGSASALSGKAPSGEKSAKHKSSVPDVSPEKLSAADKTIRDPKSHDDLAPMLEEMAAHPYHKEVNRRLVEVGGDDMLERAHWSKKQNVGPDGDYTPERKETHEAIIGELLNPAAKTKPGEKPIAYFVIGPPASGKTSVISPLVKEFGVEFTTINSDDVKERLPEYEGWNAGLVHHESAEVADMIQYRALKERHNVLFDQTGKTSSSMMAQIDDLAGDGYEVHVTQVALPGEKASKRAWDRFRGNAFGADGSKPPGRYVPPHFAGIIVDGKPNQTYNDAINHPAVSGWSKYSTDVARGEEPILLDKGHK